MQSCSYCSHTHQLDPKIFCMARAREAARLHPRVSISGKLCKTPRNMMKVSSLALLLQAWMTGLRFPNGFRADIRPTLAAKSGLLTSRAPNHTISAAAAPQSELLAVWANRGRPGSLSSTPTLCGRALIRTWMRWMAFLTSMPSPWPLPLPCL